MRKLIQDYPTMDFRCEENGDGFMVTLQYTHQKQKSNPESFVGGVNGGVSGGVNDLLVCIHANPGLSAKQLTVNLSAPKRTLERWLKQLKALGKIEFKGAPKTGGYFAK